MIHRKTAMIAAKTMANGFLLAAPDRVANNLQSILQQHDIASEVVYVWEHTRGRYTFELTELICSNAVTQVSLGIEKRKGRAGVDIVLQPEIGRFFSREDASEALAHRILEILCENGATDNPDVCCEVLDSGAKRDRRNE